MAARRRTAARRKPAPATRTTASRATARGGGGGAQTMQKAIAVLGASTAKGPRPGSLWIAYRGQDHLFVLGRTVPAWAAAWRGAKVKALTTVHDLMKALDVAPRLEAAVLEHYPMAASAPRRARQPKRALQADARRLYAPPPAC